MASGEAEPLKYQTWVLKVLIHCNGCTREVRKVLQSIDGVYRTVVDSQQHKVTVVGDVAVDVLIKKLVKIGKRAEVWPEKPQPNKEKGKKKEKEDKKEKKGNNQRDEEEEEEEKKNANGKEEKLKQSEEKKEKKKDANGKEANPKQQPEEKKEKKKDANGKEAKPKQQPEEKKEKKNEASDSKKKASGKEPDPAGDEAEKNSGGENASSQQQKQRQMQYQQQQEVWEQFTPPTFLPPPVLVTSYNVAHPSSAGYWNHNSPVPMMSPAPEVLLPFHQPMPKFFYDYYQQTRHCCAKSGGVCGGSHSEPIDNENAAACRVM